MRTVDAAPFYDLPEAGRLLWADPARLEREARARRIPAARLGDGWVLPQAWVDAEAGVQPADAESLRTYWLTRLAPPSRAARRVERPLSRLPAERLLPAAEAARRLHCDAARLERLEAEGTLPALRVDGRLLYDAVLVEALCAEEAAGPAGGPVAAARRALVLAWSEAEYTSGVPAPPPTTVGEAPRAFSLPDDLLPTEPPPRPGAGDPVEPPPSPRPRLARAEGFQTLDED